MAPPLYDCPLVKLHPLIEAMVLPTELINDPGLYMDRESKNVQELMLIRLSGKISLTNKRTELLKK